VLWSLTPADEASLDAYEGIATGLYWKTTIDVEVKTESVRALIYVAGNSRFGSPRKDYINKLLAAAERHQLSATYIGELRAWL
ncbi:MAG: gamma-glutamylcyclotransferase, partial [Nitrospirota bacterium]|nr:gamma-glutamylcyclotransferase [Nitrospirota bacterium]